MGSKYPGNGKGRFRVPRIARRSTCRPAKPRTRKRPFLESHSRISFQEREYYDLRYRVKPGVLLVLHPEALEAVSPVDVDPADLDPDLAQARSREACP